jgi:hypothetical protein
MIEIKLKCFEDFRRLVRSQGTVYFKKTSSGFTYYVISEEVQVGLILAYRSNHPLKFNEKFNPEDPDGMSVGYLVEIEEISSLQQKREDFT